MISSIEVQNIRVFDEQMWKFSLKPISIFCGTNSSGKSTLLKVLLLLRQSMGIGEASLVKDGRLRLAGTQVDLGDYSCFISNNDVQKDISIGISISSKMPVEAAKLTSASVDLADELSSDAPSSKHVNYCLRALFQFTNRQEHAEVSHEQSSSHVNIESLSSSPKGYLKVGSFDLSIKDKLLISWSIEYAGVDNDGDSKYDIFFQEGYFEADFLNTQKGIPELVIDNTTKPGYVKFVASLSGLLPHHFFIAQLKPDISDNESSLRSSSDAEDNSSEGSWAVFRLPQVVFNVTQHLRNSLENIDYLGPLRSPAKRYYLTHLDTIPNIDSAGEFLPLVLKDMELYNTWYLPPRSTSLEPRQERLTLALNQWLHYIRTGEVLAETNIEEISLETTKALLEFRIKSSLRNELHALADSGFGYSQLLPIVVRALIAEPETTIIIEQPELHLNPAIQVRLAEFLFVMAKVEKQVLIETHSEHIVNTIRVLVAEDDSEKLSDLCKIFYLDVSKGHPLVHELLVRPDGTVPKWPQEFFGEAASLTGRLLRAQRRFRK
jgi:predicted ATPase